MPAQSLAAAAALVAFAVNGNRVELKLDHGAAELGWITHNTFRMRHSLDGALPLVKWPDKEKVTLTVEETPDEVLFYSKFLQVQIQKRGLLLQVRRHDGTPLMSDLTPAVRLGAGVAWDRAAGPSDRFYGLGPKTEPAYDLRGKQVKGAVPLLLSSAGYGEYHNAAGACTFDLARDKPDRYRIEAPAVDYYFFYGPSAKEIFEEASITRSGVTATPLPEARTGTWDTLRDQVLRIAHASMSAVLMPVFDMTPYLHAPAPLAERARQLGQISVGLVPEKSAQTPFRRRLASFFTTYGEEARDRGYPYFHALPFQFPEDAEGARHADEFLLGDEMLVAPIYSPSGAREVYLPRGIWTNLDTNEVHRGRRTITVRQPTLPLFARNGTIVPLDGLRPGEPMQLNYFPSLGAEFFLLEAAVSDWSQVHAAPAADIVRLEIESKVERLYEWVVHNAAKPGKVEFEAKRYVEVKAPEALKDGAWFYDSGSSNLHVRVLAGAGADVIVNVITPE